MKSDIWLKSVLLNDFTSTPVLDVHVDELIDNWDSLDADASFSESLRIFNSLASEIQKKYAKGELQIDLSFSLIESELLLTVPLTYEELISQYDKLNPPEILIGKPKPEVLIPKIEYYACPIPFKIGSDENDQINFTYQTYRTPQQLRDGETYSRWFSVIYY